MLEWHFLNMIPDIALNTKPTDPSFSNQTYNLLCVLILVLQKDTATGSRQYTRNAQSMCSVRGTWSSERS